MDIASALIIATKQANYRNLRATFMGYAMPELLFALQELGIKEIVGAYHDEWPKKIMIIFDSEEDLQKARQSLRVFEGGELYEMFHILIGSFR